MPSPKYPWTTLFLHYFLYDLQYIRNAFSIYVDFRYTHVHTISVRFCFTEGASILFLPDAFQPPLHAFVIFRRTTSCGRLADYAMSCKISAEGYAACHPLFPESTIIAIFDRL